MSNKQQSSIEFADIRLRECDLFELAHVLRIRPVLEEGEKDEVMLKYPSVRLWNYYEDSERSLLILLCGNEKEKKETLLVRHHQLYQKVVFKEIPWFQGPVRSVQSLSLDPSGTWLLCSCKDRHLYLVPVMGLVLGPEEVDCPPHWKNNDLTKFPPHDRKGITTSIVWWNQSLVNTHICILGTELGEIVFVDLHKFGQTVFQTVVEGAVRCLNIVQDKVHGTSYLLIQTQLGSTWKLLLESYSLQSGIPPDLISLSVDRLGFEILSQQSAPLHSLLAQQQDMSSFHLEQVRCKSESEVVHLSVQFARNQFFLGVLNVDTKIFEVFDVDRESVPMFVYDLNEFTRKVLLTDRLLFTVSGRRNKAQINILSSQMAETGAFGLNIKNKEKPLSLIQTFLLPPGESVLAIYRFTMYTLEKTRKVGNDQLHPVDGCLVITTAAVYEIRPRVSPEELFIDLAVNNVDTTAADRLAIITGLDVNTLYEQAGDIAMEAGQLRHALDLYQASKCPHSLRVKKFSHHASVADVITYIQEILQKPSDVSSLERKQLANMAVKCFVQQVLEKDSNNEEMIKLKEDFCQFINDNFDYDEYGALELLASYGLEEYLFQVAKARGLINEALDALSRKGHYHLSQSSQAFLIAKGFADAVCQSSNGAFLRCLPPENTIQLVLAKPESILPHLRYVESLLPVLDEAHLLRIAKLFDPSRPAAKTLLLNFTGTPRRQRSYSGGSQTSMDSYLSFRDDSGPGIPDLLQLFLSTLLVLNSKRQFEKFPDMSLIAEHCEDKTKSKELEESILRGGILPEHVTLSCGQQHSALVTSDGDVYTWGKSCNGRLGHGDLIEEAGKLAPFRVELLHIQKIKVQSVACGREHTLALTKQGVYSWGSSDYGQLGLGDNKKQTRPVFLTELADKDCVTLACGYYHSLALSGDRNVLAWGWGVHGQLGFGNVEDYLVPGRVASLDRRSVIRLAAGYSHSAVLTSQGKVFTFGGGVFGQLGLGPIKKQSTPKLVEEIANEKVQLLCCGSFETMVVTIDQKFYKWGRNAQLIRHVKDYFQKMDPRLSHKRELTHHFTPVEVPLKIFSPIVQIRCGSSHAIFLTESGRVYTMGQNDHGQLGLGSRSEKLTPVLVQELSTHHVVAVAAGAAHCVAVNVPGQTFVWGRGDSGQLGLETEKLKDVTLPTLLKNLPINKMSDKLASSLESLEDPKLNGLEYEKELSDLSSIGDCLYGREALATSLYQLWGYYNERNVLKRCSDANDPFSSSVIFKIQEKWAVFLSFRLKALTMWFNKVKELASETDSLARLKSLAKEIIEEVIRTLSSTCTNDYYPVHEAVMVVNEILRFWSETHLNHSALEELFVGHLDFLACPLSLLVVRDASIRDAECVSGSDDVTRQYSTDNLAHCNRTSYLRRTFSPEFLFRVTKATVEQLKTEFPKRSVFSQDLDILYQRTRGTTVFITASETEHNGTSEHALHEFEVEMGQISREKLWREILDHFKRNLEKTNAISLSTTAASTLAAASLNLHEEELRLSKQPSSVNVVAFTCEHSFPLVHFINMILPEFEQRMNELPKPLSQMTQRLFTRYLQRTDPYPTSCPVCVYNFLRQEQLQDKSFMVEGKGPKPWEI